MTFYIPDDLDFFIFLFPKQPIRLQQLKNMFHFIFTPHFSAYLSHGPTLTFLDLQEPINDCIEIRIEGDLLVKLPPVRRLIVEVRNVGVSERRISR